MNWNWKKMISIVLVVTVCTTGSAIAQAVECDVPQYTFSDENIEIVDPALFYDLFTQDFCKGFSVLKSRLMILSATLPTSPL